MKALECLAVPLDEILLIEASAGTGKTYTIETLFLRLLLERSLPVESILVVTYTNAAAAELRTRIRNRVTAAQRALGDGALGGEEDWQRLLRARAARGQGEVDRLALLSAVYSLDQASILTIHSFCQRVLQDLAFHTGAPYGTRLIADQTALLDEAVRDFWVRELHDAPPELVRFLGDELRTMVALAHRAVAQPDLALVPPPAAEAHVTDLLGRWRQLRQRAARRLAEGRAEVERELRASGAIRADVLARWTDQLAADLSSTAPFSGKATEHLDRYSSATAKKELRGDFFVVCAALQECENLLLAGCAARRLALRHGVVEFVRRELRRRKEESNVAYFDDLLQRVFEALSGARGDALAAALRQRHPVALIDEFQDTDPAQYAIFTRIYAPRSDAEPRTALFLVGDPKQAIYGFRGADVFAYSRAREKLTEDARALRVNRRSTRPLVEAVNAVFARAKRADGDDFLVAGIEFEPVEASPQAPPPLADPGWGPLRFLVCPHDGSKALNKEESRKRVQAGVVAEIARLLASPPHLDGRRLEPRDIAVLCRTNSEAAALQTALRGLGIPSVLQGDASVFDAPEAEEMQRVLRAMAEPRDTGAVLAALATAIIGCDARELYELRAEEGDLAAEAAEPDEHDWRSLFRDWHALWERHGFMPAFRRMLEQSRAPERLLALADGERRLTNVLHLAELLQSAAHDERRGPLALVEWLGLMREDAERRTEMAAEAAQIRLERDEQSLILTTIHKSKGLQYPVVFCPFLWGGRMPKANELLSFHDPEHELRRSLDVDPDSSVHLERAQLEALAEDLRLLYVALTRAQYACAVVWGRFSTFETSALGYVLHGADEGPDAVAATRRRLASLSEKALRTDLEDLRASAAPDAIEIAALADTPCPPYQAAAGSDPAALCARRFARRSLPPWRVSSFSALVAERIELSEAAREGLDRDEGVAEAVPREDPGRRRVPLAELPSGTRTGLMLHKILELVDFAALDGAEATRTIEREVARYGLERRWRDVVAAALREVADTPLPLNGESLRLRDVARCQRIDEMEFVFPVGGASGVPLVSASALADVLARHGSPRAAPEYAERLRELAFQDLAGFLRGYIDLVFEHRGRWYVVDYKSNLLGPGAAAYAAEALRNEMVASHYFLQYHLYVVAVHRHLAARLADYQYERNFGGVFYLFLRGMSAANPEPWGVFADRPSALLVDELSTTLSPLPARPRGGG